jgi:hypothetical protein
MIAGKAVALAAEAGTGIEGMVAGGRAGSTNNPPLLNFFRAFSVQNSPFFCAACLTLDCI